MAQIKFDRNYSLKVEISNGSILTITLPFTIEFNIIKNILTSANVCEIRIYNLSPKNRNLMRFDFSNYGTVRKVQLNAGYGLNTPLIFSGNIQQAWSVREGVDFITTIQCFDGGDSFVNGIIPSNANFPTGTSMKTLLETLISYLPNVSIGLIGDNFIYDKGQLILLKRSASPTGNVVANLRELTGGAFFIDNGKAYILSNSDCISGQIGTINAQSGLLGTPLREQYTVSVEMLFEPYIVMGQFIKLESLTAPQFNSSNVSGNYKVSALTHKATISPTICGDAITSLQFFSGLSPLRIVRSV